MKTEKRCCVQCGADLPSSNTQKNSNIPTRSVKIGHIDPGVLFCTLTCAAIFGVNAANKHIEQHAVELAKKLRIDQDRKERSPRGKDAGK